MKKTIGIIALALFVGASLTYALVVVDAKTRKLKLHQMYQVVVLVAQDVLLRQQLLKQQQLEDVLLKQQNHAVVLVSKI